MSTEKCFPLFDGAAKDSQIAPNLLHLIGHTPMVYLSEKTNPTKAKIALKLESENPMASVKDRLALSIIINAEKDGLIKPGESTLVECTSGNTGIAIAQIAAIRGYKCVLVMPESMSQERRCLLSIFNCKVILTPAKFGMKGAYLQTKKVLEEMPGAFSCAQFETKYNAQMHRETTGPEIWKQTEGKIAAFISGAGTGGTVTGCGQFFKSKEGANVKVYVVEPDESAVISGEKAGPHAIQGIGAGFVPEVIDRSVLDGVLRVKTADALAVAKTLPMNEGIFAGISTGAAIDAALQLAKQPEYEGKLIVAIMPSFGERYLSTKLFEGVRDEVAKWPVVSEQEIQALMA